MWVVVGGGLWVVVVGAKIIAETDRLRRPCQYFASHIFDRIMESGKSLLAGIKD